ncbi:MAG: patatin-like phospholipase family protein [Pseudomonadota bacterium]
MGFQTDPSESATVAPREVVRQSAEAVIAQAVADAPGRAAQLDILVLSAGGQYGAFGAGFMQGWSTNGRPDFNIVTGVSAGAMIAPVAFAGPEFDGLLDRYNGLDEGDVLRRNYLRILTSSSATTPGPLADYLDDSLDEALLTRIAERQEQEGAELYISAASLDTTASRVFRISDIAASDAEMQAKRDCIREAMLASAAVPIIFPPRHIDGELYADGGLREHVFLEGIVEAVDAFRSNGATNIDVNVYIIINGELAKPQLTAAGLPAEPVDNNVFGIAGRSASILADDVLRSSIIETIRVAQNPDNIGDWTIQGIVAPAEATANCTSEDFGFDACVTSALFAAGKSLASQPDIPWLTGDRLLKIAQEL